MLPHFEMGGGFRVRQVGFRGALKMGLGALNRAPSVAGKGQSGTSKPRSLGTWGEA